MGIKQYRLTLLKQVNDLMNSPNTESSNSFVYDAQRAKRTIDSLVKATLPKLDETETEELEKKIEGAEKEMNEKLGDAVDDVEQARPLEEKRKWNLGQGEAFITYCEVIFDKLLELLIAEDLVPS